MRYCSLVMGVFVGCLLAPAVAYSNDVEDLKAAYEQWLQAYNARDLDTVMSFYRDPMVVYLIERAREESRKVPPGSVPEEEGSR